ncbi:hypothetical protein [Commensalibacter oyaizuii]|uniref:Uncharacterized protein n=1 Tax=Commensalibacter oyaizuii TaxID=3043873 RepID=A0ABT6Q2I4_9PROT|nr:hypothetical protein [Commensalibacter sp. TBRC 16381]MDI2091339.1 hypothetical protein [Commensalibacter sp. TBRC 16381]
MNIHPYVSPSRLYKLFFTFIVAGLVTGPLAYSASQHHKKTSHHQQNIKLGKVTLTPQPDNALATIARNLNQTDLNFAIHRNEQPLLLIGTANLSSTKTAKIVLFTQIQSASLCGSGGCSTTAYLKRNNQWVKVLDSVTGDIEIKKTKHKGMHDLLIGTSDSWIWNGKTYVESQKGPKLTGLKRSIENHQKSKL